MGPALTAAQREARRRRCIFCGQSREERARGKKFVEKPELIAPDSVLTAPQANHACKQCAAENTAKVGLHLELETKQRKSARLAKQAETPWGALSPSMREKLLARREKTKVKKPDTSKDNVKRSLGIDLTNVLSAAGVQTRHGSSKLASIPFARSRVTDHPFSQVLGTSPQLVKETGNIDSERVLQTEPVAASPRPSEVDSTDEGTGVVDQILNFQSGDDVGGANEVDVSSSQTVQAPKRQKVGGSKYSNLTKDPTILTALRTAASRVKGLENSNQSLKQQVENLKDFKEEITPFLSTKKSEKEAIESFTAARRLCEEAEAVDMLSFLARAIVSGALPLGSTLSDYLQAVATNLNEEDTSQWRFSKRLKTLFAFASRAASGHSAMDSLRGPMNAGASNLTTSAATAKMNLMIPSKQALQQFEAKDSRAEGRVWQEGIDESKIKELDEIAKGLRAEGDTRELQVRVSWDSTDLEKSLTVTHGRFVGDHNSHVAPVLEGLVSAPDPRQLESDLRSLSEGLDRATNALIDGSQIKWEKDVRPAVDFLARSVEELQAKVDLLDEKIKGKEKEYQRRLRSKASAKGKSVDASTALELNAKQLAEINKLSVQKQSLIGACAGVKEILKEAGNPGLVPFSSREGGDDSSGESTPEVGGSGESSSRGTVGPSDPDVRSESVDASSDRESGLEDAGCSGGSGVEGQRGSGGAEGAESLKLETLHFLVSLTGLVGQVFFEKRVALGS